MLNPSVVYVSNFLASLFKDGASYDAVNAARSALSAFIPSASHATIGSRPNGCRLVKGTFEERPALPKYTDTWYVSQVLDHLCLLPTISELTLKQLTLRTVMLLTLLTGQRGHASHLVTVDDLRMSKDKCAIVSSSKHTQTKAGVHTAPAEISAFESNLKLSLVSHLREYLRRTASLRKGKKLFVLVVVVPVSRTFSRWVKETLADVGINTDRYSYHSTRAASCSAASRQGMNLSAILQAAGWSSNSTFSCFYRKVVVDSPANFG